MTAAQFPKLLTPAEVAAMFRVEVPTVARWRKEGKLAAVRAPLGRTIRYFDAEVRALLDGEPLTPEQIEALKAQAGGTQ